METENLRKECKKLMIDLDFDVPGGRRMIAENIGVNCNSLSMALTGYRDGPGSIKILTSLHEYLSDVRVMIR